MTNQSKPQYEIKVYKLWIEDKPNEFYIGSTKYSRLCHRMKIHRYRMREGNNSKLYQTIRAYGGVFKYTQLASCMVSCKDEQNAFEQQWIDKLKPTLNTNAAYTGIKGNLTYNREYKNQKKRICVCGGRYIDMPVYARRHYNTSIHIKFVKNMFHFLQNNHKNEK
jgi:hypothetical protein